MDEPEFEHLMRTYYDEDFETLWSGTEEYMAETPPEDQRQLLIEIDEVLSNTARSDADLGAHLHNLGCYALIDESSGGYRGWLEEIARRVRAHLGE